MLIYIIIRVALVVNLFFLLEFSFSVVILSVFPCCLFELEMCLWGECVHWEPVLVNMVWLFLVNKRYPINPSRSHSFMWE
jgi:hypothetical protein